MRHPSSSFESSEGSDPRSAAQFPRRMFLHRSCRLASQVGITAVL
jgi:hypothetical protein